MSHADRISQLYNSRKALDLAYIGQCMTDELGMRLMEFVRNYDPSDVKCMPHVFPARLARWEHVMEQLAVKEDNPVAALASSIKAVTDWSVQYKRATSFDWDYQTSRYIGDSDEPVKMSLLEAEKLLYVARGISHPDTALPEAIDLQKQHALQAREKAMSTFCKLAKQYPAEALAALEDMTPKYSDNLSRHLAGIIDLDAFKTQLNAAIPPGYTKKAKKPVTQPQEPFF